MKKKDSANSVKENSNASNYSNAISQRKEVGLTVLHRTSPLLVKPEMLKMRQIVGFLTEILGNIKITPTRTRGIAKMGVKYFYAAWDKSTTLTKNFPPMLYVFDFQYLLGGLSELKILVSVVRFRPGPPRFNLKHPSPATGVFCFKRKRKNNLRLTHFPLMLFPLLLNV
jgi:hypothetical protein